MAFTKRSALLAAATLLLTAQGAPAQNGTPPPGKFGGEGNEGDPNGAVRALGSADDDDDGKAKPGVVVPRLGGENEGRAGRLPPGTTGPGR